MTALPSTRNLSAFYATGTEAAPAGSTGLVTLTATDDYYFEVPICSESKHVSIQILTDAAVVGTFTIEGTNFPNAADGTNIATVPTWNETSGNWVQINTASAGYVQTTGTGWTPTVLSLAKTAGAGGAIFNISSVGFKRLRLHAAVTTTGAARVMAHGKT